MSEPREYNSRTAIASAGRVLVCFAVAAEARGFTPPVRPVTEVLITGMGLRQARASVERYLAGRRPTLVLSCGFAGGLNPKHSLGTVLFDDTHAGIFRDRRPGCGAQPGRFVHADRVLASVADKARLFQSSGGDAVEMESSGIVSVCRAANLPVLVLRVISDTAAEDLPMDFNRYCRPDGSLSLPRLLWGLARSPGVIPELIRFQSRLRQASGELAGTLERWLAELHEGSACDGAPPRSLP
ncbi:MAG: hypothetical protein MUE94_09380 [Verrucomicrobia bacterium]|jgi:nucleoside phosphorylase|nr:hypothetical protein [Verrucomicrobiota bacterium]